VGIHCRSMDTSIRGKGRRRLPDLRCPNRGLVWLGYMPLLGTVGETNSQQDPCNQVLHDLLSESPSQELVMPGPKTKSIIEHPQIPNQWPPNIGGKFLAQALAHWSPRQGGPSQTCRC